MNNFLSGLSFYKTPLKWSEFSSSIKTSIIIFVFLAIFFIVMGIVFSKMDPEKDEVPNKGIKFLCVVLVDTINKFVENNLGKENRNVFAAYFLGIASFISLANIASVFGLNPPFANLGVALSLSALAFFIFQFTGFKYQGIKERVNGFMGPVKAISPIMLPISIIGEFTTPFSMGMRMFGNLFSGVVIAGMVFGLAEGLGAILIPVIGDAIGVALVASVIHPIFDVFFGLLQMYVYFMLTTMFVKQNM